MAFRDDGETALYVTANLPKAGNLHDQVVIIIPRLDPGSSTVSVNCTANTCAELGFIVAATGSETSFDRLCVFESGTLTIATLSASRATGSFSGNGVCETQGGTGSLFAVTGGSFNVPITNIPVF